MNTLEKQTALNGYSDIAKVLKKHLNRDISNLSFYSHILEWNEWYKGYVASFHSTTVANGINVVKRDIYSLKMAKRVAEDWASAALSEPVKIAIEGDRNKSSLFVQGSRGDGGVLGSNDYIVCTG